LRQSKLSGARTAILYAFDLIEHDGEEMRNRCSSIARPRWDGLVRNTEAGILSNEHIAEDGVVVIAFAHACRLGAEGIVSKRVNGTY
jgi:bifunctional non-homologous end joining protein LigD